MPVVRDSLDSLVEQSDNRGDVGVVLPNQDPSYRYASGVDEFGAKR